MRALLVWIVVACAAVTWLRADEPATVRFATTSGAMALAVDGRATPVLVDEQDWPGVVRVAGDAVLDLERVTGVKPALVHALPAAVGSDVVVVGTVGRSRWLDELERAGKLDVAPIRGRWEAHVRVVVTDPWPGVARALVIAGSDKRGTIFGVYGLSEAMGVSPWYWWADAPVTRRASVWVTAGARVDLGPVVRYRGIFLNDEAPALTGWARERFGGLNADFYGHVFELLLRLRANYLWPAMWDNAFAVDDPRNAELADRYGIVMGTSHHEPMMRAHKEWSQEGRGGWNYGTNAEVLREFWAKGIRRQKSYENLVTIGMRGDGDEPMSEEANVALLERIVHDQRTILERETGHPAAETPQLWALYKEVQEYFEKGMRVPDDVTLLWCDDNWGNIRRLPSAAERNRPGGAGVYYHFDYVGGPRSYKWLNTVPLPKIWEQMHTAWQHGADRIWIVNVGDLKPMELPIDFFLRYAWDPAAWPAGRLGDYTRLWAERIFGVDTAAEIAGIVDGYTQLNGLRKPEMLDPGIFSLVNYDEGARIVAEWTALVARVEAVKPRVAPAAQDAFYQLVEHPVRACAVVNELIQAVGLNRIYAPQGRVATNTQAQRARALFAQDAALTERWNSTFAGGRWRRFMDQTHLGYTYWQQPPRNALPAVQEVQPSARGELAVAIEGHERAWPTDDPGLKPPVLPPLESQGAQSRWVEVFNRGATPVRFTTAVEQPWLIVTPTEGDVTEQTRVTVSVRWADVPVGTTTGSFTIRGADGRSVRVRVPVTHSAEPLVPGVFYESDRYVAIEAVHATRVVSGASTQWKRMDGLGRTVGSMLAWPTTAASVLPGDASARLDYDLALTSAGRANVTFVTAPTLAYVPGRGVRLALSMDDGEPQLVDCRADPTFNEWERSVADGVRQTTVAVTFATPGRHTLRVWLVDAGVSLQRIVVDFGGVRRSYLGPPESRTGSP